MDSKLFLQRGGDRCLRLDLFEGQGFGRGFRKKELPGKGMGFAHGSEAFKAPRPRGFKAIALFAPAKAS